MIVFGSLKTHSSGNYFHFKDFLIQMICLWLICLESELMKIKSTTFYCTVELHQNVEKVLKQITAFSLTLSNTLYIFLTNQTLLEQIFIHVVKHNIYLSLLFLLCNTLEENLVGISYSPMKLFEQANLMYSFELCLLFTFFLRNNPLLVKYVMLSRNLLNNHTIFGKSIFPF